MLATPSTQRKDIQWEEEEEEGACSLLKRHYDRVEDDKYAIVAFLGHFL